MSGSSAPTTLQVYLYGQVIGSLDCLPGERFLFTLDEAHLDNPNRNTLSFS